MAVLEQDFTEVQDQVGSFGRERLGPRKQLLEFERSHSRKGNAIETQLQQGLPKKATLLRVACGLENSEAISLRSRRTSLERW